MIYRFTNILFSISILDVNISEWNWLAFAVGILIWARCLISRIQSRIQTVGMMINVQWPGVYVVFGLRATTSGTLKIGIVCFPCAWLWPSLMKTLTPRTDEVRTSAAHTSCRCTCCVGMTRGLGDAEITLRDNPLIFEKNWWIQSAHGNSDLGKSEMAQNGDYAH